jgi:chromosome segregation ATPase
MFKKIFFINAILIICFILFLIPKVNSETLEDEIVYLENEIETLKNRIDDLKSEIDYLKNEIETIEIKINDLEGKIETEIEDEINNLKNEIDYLETLEDRIISLKNGIEDLGYKIDLIASNIGYITPMPSKTIIEEIKELNNKIYEIEYLKDKIEFANNSIGLLFILFTVLSFAFSITCYEEYEYAKRIKKLEDYIKAHMKE